MLEIDPKGAEGKDVDEMLAHRFLEKLGMTLTALKMREALRDIDIDFNRMVSMSEYLLYRYKEQGANIKTLVNSTGSDNQEEINSAQALLDDAQQKLTTSRTQAEAARVDEAAAVDSEAQVSCY